MKNLINLFLYKFGSLINISSYIFLYSLFYLFVWDLRIFDFFQIFIFSIFSFAISMFISDNFKLSNNLFIKILQKLVLINSILALLGFIYYLLDISIFPTLFCDVDSDNDTDSDSDSDREEETKNNNNEESGLKDIARITTNKDDTNVEYYNFKFKKEIVDNVVEKGKNLALGVVTDIAPNLGIGAAVGKVAAEAFKHTGGMAPVSRVAIIGSTALATAAGTKIGLGLGEAFIKNKNKLEEINSSSSLQSSSNASKQDLDINDGRDSPSNFDSGFIHSVLEESEIPLITIVNGLCYLNYIEFSLILSLFFLLFRKYLTSKIIGFILSLSSPALIFVYKKKLRGEAQAEGINKYNKNSEIKGKNLKSKTLSFFEKIVNSLNKNLNTLDKYSNFLIVFVFLCLIWIKFINIYYSSYLSGDIDSFVNVYNHIKSQSFGFLFFSAPAAQALKNESVALFFFFRKKKLACILIFTFALAYFY